MPNIEPLNKRIENANRCLTAATTMLEAKTALNSSMLANINDCCISGYEQSYPEMHDVARAAVNRIENSQLKRSVVETNVQQFKAFLTQWKTKANPSNY